METSWLLFLPRIHELNTNKPNAEAACKESSLDCKLIGIEVGGE